MLASLLRRCSAAGSIEALHAEFTCLHQHCTVWSFRCAARPVMVQTCLDLPHPFLLKPSYLHKPKDSLSSFQIPNRLRRSILKRAVKARTQWCHMPYGDQALFVKTGLFRCAVSFKLYACNTTDDCFTQNSLQSYADSCAGLQNHLNY